MDFISNTQFKTILTSLLGKIDAGAVKRCLKCR